MLMTDQTKFVLLSAARSGTSLCIETWKSHPQILAQGEIFHPEIHAHLSREFLVGHDLSLRDNDPIAFADQVLNFSMGRKAVGFKMWKNQSPVVCDYLMRDESVIKIILERSNLLAHYSSNLLAEKTGLWNINHGTGRLAVEENNKLPFSVQDFKDFIEYYKRLFDDYRSSSRGAVIELSYVQCARLDFSKIYTALNVQHIEIEPKMVKLYSNDILSRFQAESRPLIEDELDRMGRSEWIEESV